MSKFTFKRSSSRRTMLWRLLTIVAAVAMLLPMAAPAWAAPDGWVKDAGSRDGSSGSSVNPGDAGEDGGTGGSTSGGGGGDGSDLDARGSWSWCQGVNMSSPAQVQEAADAGCFEPEDDTDTTDWSTDYSTDPVVVSRVSRWCQEGAEVWRFYGTDSNPTAAWTVSRVNPSGYCEASNSFFLHPIHPFDAGHSASQIGLPWTRGAQTNDAGETYHRSVFNGYLESGAPLRTSGSCTSLQPPSDRLDPYVDGSQADTEAGQEVRDFLTQRYYTIRDAFTPMGESAAREWAQHAVNTNGVSDTIGYFVNGRHNVVANQGDLDYHDNLDCSSAYDFVDNVDEATPAGQQPRKVFAGCAVPLTREIEHVTMSDGTTRTEPQGGKVYDTLAWGEQNNGIDYEQTYRNVIESDVSSRGSAAGADPAGSGTPSEQAAAHAYCFNSTAAIGVDSPDPDNPDPDDPTPDNPDPDDPVDPGPEPDGITMTVRVPRAGHVGGEMMFYGKDRIEVEVGDLMCGGSPCSTTGTDGSMYVANTRATIDVRAPAGFHHRDWEWDGEEVETRKSFTMRPGETRNIEMEFYRATPVEGRFRVYGRMDVTVYQLEPADTTLSGYETVPCGFNPTTGVPNYCTDTVSGNTLQSTTVSVPVTVRYEYLPDGQYTPTASFPVVQGSSTPNS